MSNLLTKKISFSRPTLTEKVKAEQNQASGNPTKSNSQLLEFFINNSWLIITLLCLLVIASSVLWFFWPRYQKTLLEVKDSYQQASINLAEKQKYQNNLIRLNDFYKNIDKKTRDNVIDMLSVTLDKENLLAEIEAICERYNLIIKSSNVTANQAEAVAPAGASDTIATDNLRTALINLELQGKNYQNFKGLLQTIANNLHLMDIQRLDYIPGSNQISLDIQIYYLSD
jgi:hypothetical protein